MHVIPVWSQLSYCAIYLFIYSLFATRQGFYSIPSCVCHAFCQVYSSQFRVPLMWHKKYEACGYLLILLLYFISISKLHEALCNKGPCMSFCLTYAAKSSLQTIDCASVLCMVYVSDYRIYQWPLLPRWAPCWPHEPCYQGGYKAISDGHVLELIIVSHIMILRIMFTKSLPLHRLWSGAMGESGTRLLHCSRWVWNDTTKFLDVSISLNHGVPFTNFNPNMD